MSADNLAEFNSLMDANKDRVLMSLGEVIPNIDSRFLVTSGKVRETVDLRNGTLLMVASDRISTFDVVHPNGVPGKGIVLNQMSLRWFEMFDDVDNHFLSADPADFPKPFKNVDELYGRAMLVDKLTMVPIECVVRGYLTGSGWADYKKTGQVCGIALPDGMLESQQLPEPIFTPATKATTGHDINISEDEMGVRVGKQLTQALARLSIDIYTQAAIYALGRGIILADTKFEFGFDGVGGIVLGDEVLTPDSSRFWPAQGYQAGRSQPSFDKQYVRDWASGTGWDKTPPAPKLPEEIVERTRQKYIEAYTKLFG